MSPVEESELLKAEESLNEEFKQKGTAVKAEMKKDPLSAQDDALANIEYAMKVKLFKRSNLGQSFMRDKSGGLASGYKEATPEEQRSKQVDWLKMKWESQMAKKEKVESEVKTVRREGTFTSLRVLAHREGLSAAVKFAKKRMEQHTDDNPMVQWNEDWEHYEYWEQKVKTIDDTVKGTHWRGEQSASMAPPPVPQTKFRFGPATSSPTGQKGSGQQAQPSGSKSSGQQAQMSKQPSGSRSSKQQAQMSKPRQRAPRRHPS